MKVPRTNWMDLGFIVLILALLLCWDGSVCAKKKKNDIIKRCETCQDLVKKFNEVRIMTCSLFVVFDCFISYFEGTGKQEHIKLKVKKLGPA